MVKNPNLSQLAGGRQVGYFTNVAEELNSGLPRTNPACGRTEGLNPGPPDYKTSALNHSATLPPAKCRLNYNQV